MTGRIRSIILLATAPWLAVSPAAAEEAPPFDWSGLYVGLHSGGALGLADVGNPYGSSLFGDTVRSSGALSGGQIGYNWQRGGAVYGLEADVSLADMDGTNSCFATSGRFVSSNCAASFDAFGTLAGRLGWVLPSDGRTLVYGKAGFAAAYGEMDATPSGGEGRPGTHSEGWRWGWVLGAGVERAVTPRWTVKFEYDVLAFDNEGFTAPASQIQNSPPMGPLVDTPATATHVSQDIHQFKIGMNYRFGARDEDAGSAPSEISAQGGTRLTAGIRYVYGWSQFRKDLGSERGVASPASRLTYESPGIDGAEAFARLDTPVGFVVKGLVGGASGGDGDMNDEDWLLPWSSGEIIPYTNTLSSVDDEIRYWTLDLGYTWWRGAGYTITPFVGYSHFSQDMKAFGCTQLADPAPNCNPGFPTSVLGITEDDTWRSLRLGTAFDVTLAPRVTLAAEAAYLPYVDFSGTDDHVLRSLVSPETGDGRGVQLEAMLSYALTDAWSVGIGGRYWSLRTTSAEVDFGGTGDLVPMRFAAEQAHILVQGSYKFGAATPP